MGRQIAVEYHVPVLCWVDVEEGTITSVVEHTELIAETGTLIDENGEALSDKNYEGAFEVCTQIANSEDWPAWDRGY